MLLPKKELAAVEDTPTEEVREALRAESVPYAPPVIFYTTTPVKKRMAGWWTEKRTRAYTPDVRQLASVEEKKRRAEAEEVWHNAVGKIEAAYEAGEEQFPLIVLSDDEVAAASTAVRTGSGAINLGDAVEA